MIDANRFWLRVDVQSNDCDACWIWKGAVRDDGRGRFWDLFGDEIRAHRAAWEVRFGSPPPNGYKLVQKCPNWECVRHWELGEKARKLSRKALEEIQSSSLSDRTLGKRFRVHRNTICWHRRRTSCAGDNREGGLHS